MKLLFVCLSPFAMDVTTPEREPLGGSESCIAYLSRQLARNGHDVSFAARLPLGTPERVKGVRHIALADLSTGMDYDAVIALSAPQVAEELRSLAPRAFKVSWLHLTPEQSAMAPLAAMTPHIDCAVFVSEFQRGITKYQGPSQVIGNGFAPAFENMFTSAEDLRAAKQDRAAYTSMPYRGLQILEQAIGRMRGETSFDIYSAMQTYREAETGYETLYEKVKAAPRTRYHGSLPQPPLAQELKSAAYLSYACSFVETYCIAAVEAIAAGLKVVSMDLGALPETTLGFADLMPVTPDMTDSETAARYAALLEQNAAEFRKHPELWSAQRFEQSLAVNRLCSWRARAAEWEALLAAGIGHRG